MRFLVWGLAVAGLLALFWQVWQQGRASPGGYLYGMSSPQEEASYCLAVAERISEITRQQGEPALERHLDEQIDFWRARAGSLFGPGRAALARDVQAPGVNEGAHLHLAVQDCGLRAIAFYGHRFTPLG